MMRIIAELGINHRGSTAVAEQLIDIAHQAGAWGIKFQYRSRDGFYQAANEIGDEIISQELERCYIAPEALLELSERAWSLGLKVGVSFFKFSNSADFGESLSRFDFFKVPSAELLNQTLIESLAALGKPIILSTGGHDEADIFKAIDRTRALGDFTYLHCISNYPVLLGNQQLSFIKRLKAYTDAPVGYSTHDQDWEVCLVAAANGATVFERHLTLDKQGGGLDDSSSSDPEEFARLCKLLGAYEAMQGDGSRVINQGELINMQNLGSSLYAKRDLHPGERISLDNCDVKAPRKGLTFAELDKRQVFHVQRSVPAGTALSALHLTPPKPPLSAPLRAFCDAKELSLPVRLHDVAVLQGRFPIKNYELHLSYTEVETFRTAMAETLAQLDLTRQYSIHIPDYLRGNRLVDPLSNDEATRRDSQTVIEACVQIAVELEARTGASVPIVGSFSRLLPEGKRATYERLYETIRGASEPHGIHIYPQWLPRIAWYFGGAEVLDMFCGSDDIEIVRDLGMELCLDLSHLILSANYEKADWRQWFEALKPLARHLHIADATGIDGEGIEFGKGDLGDPAPFLTLEGRKVLEVWQGHLSEGDGFERAIQQLGSDHA